MSLIILGLILDIIGVILILWPSLERSIMIIFKKRKLVDFFWWQGTKDRPDEIKKMLFVFFCGFVFLVVGFILQIIGNYYQL